MANDLDVVLTIRVPKELKERLDAVATKRMAASSTLARFAMDEYLEQEEQRLGLVRPETVGG